MNSLVVKRILGDGFRLVRKKSLRRVVLLYHAVGEGPDACPEELFAEHMDWLARSVEVLPLDVVLKGNNDAPVQVAITFDDGYASVAQLAAPIMARHGFIGTVYLTASCIGTDNRSRRISEPKLGHLQGESFMIWSEAASLKSAGWQIGSHGLDHVDLTAQNSEGLERQLRCSKELIETELSTTSPAFAYPWGRNAEHVREAVRAAGYRHAAGTLHGPLHTKSNELAFPRIDIRRDYTTDDLASVVRGDWDYLGFIQTLRLNRHVGS